MSNLTIEFLTPDQVRLAYPVIRHSLPGLNLASWLRFARHVAVAHKAGRAGIIAARRTGRPYLCGLFCYRVDHDLEQGRVLIAEHFVAMDLLEPEEVLAAMVAELDALGRRLGCNAVRSMIHDGSAEVAGGLARAGHTQTGTLLFKDLSPPTSASTCA